MSRSDKSRGVEAIRPRTLARVGKKRAAELIDGARAEAAALARADRRALVGQGGGALTPEGDYGRVAVAHTLVPDPFPDPKGRPRQRIRVAVNFKRDVLEWEHKRGALSDGAYLQGRLIQQALEFQGGSGQSQWIQGDKVDAGSLVALAIARNLDRAKMAQNVIDHLHRELGRIDAAVIVLSLRQPGTWSELAQRWGRDHDDMRKELAWRFRRGLEHLAQRPL